MIAFLVALSIVIIIIVVEYIVNGTPSARAGYQKAKRNCEASRAFVEEVDKFQPKKDKNE